MGTSASHNACTACVVTWTFPIRLTWHISPMRTSCSSLSLSLTVSTAPLFPSFTPWLFRYRGRSSLRGVIMGRTSRFTGLRVGTSNSASCRGSSTSSAAARHVSSGRQIPTNEHPGHFGESTSGAGISPASAKPHASRMSASVSAISASSNATRTRWPDLR